MAVDVNSSMWWRTRLDTPLAFSLFQSRDNRVAAELRRRKHENKTGGGDGACNNFFKRPVQVYQLLVYPLIGQFWQITSTLSKRVVPVTQRDGVRRPRASNRGIHDLSLPFSFFPPRQLFACLFLSRLPHYLRAWNRLIGFWHEQSRLEWDNYSKINWENTLGSTLISPF